MSTSTLLKLAFQNFREYLEVERNVSRLTIRNYSHYLRRFIDWLEKEGIKDLKKVDQELIRKYRVFLSRYLDKHGNPLTKRTQSYYIIAIRSWLKWLIKQDADVLHPEKIDLPKAESYSMNFLTTEQIKHLLLQPDVTKSAGLRDKAILELLFSTGLRVSELVNLNRDQVDLDRQEFGIIGKGRKPRVVFLSERAVIWMDKWITTRRDKWIPFFIRFSGKKSHPDEDGEEMRLTSRSVQRLVDTYSRKAKLPIKISPHTIRHTFATDMLYNGAGLRDVQEMLGHKSIATTQIYTHVTRPKLRKVHGKFHSKL